MSAVITCRMYELAALSMFDSQGNHNRFWIAESQLPEKRNEVFFLLIAQVELLNDIEEFNGIF